MIPQDANLPDPTSPLPSGHSHHPRPIAGRIDGPQSATRPTAPPAPSGPTALAAGPDVFSLLVALRHRWISAILLGGTLAAVAATAVWFLLVPKNTAFAQLRVLYLDPSLLKDTVGGPIDFKTTLQTTAHEVTSRRVIGSALKRDEVKQLHLELKEVDPVQTISEDIRADFKENSELLTIVYIHPDPTVAVTVANAIKNAYLEEVVFAKKNERSLKVTQLEKAYSESTDQFKIKKESLKKTAENLGSDPQLWREQRLELTTNLRDSKLQKTQVGYRIFEVTSQLDVFDARLKAMKGADSKSPLTAEGKAQREARLEAFLEADAQYRELEKRKADFEEDIEVLVEKGYLDAYPPLKSLRERLKTVKKNARKRKDLLTQRFEKAPLMTSPSTAGTSYREDPAIIREQLQKQVAALKTLDETIEKNIVAMTKQANTVPTLAAEYEQLAAEITREEKQITQLGANLDIQKIELRAASRITSYQDAMLMKQDAKKQLLATAVAPLAVFFAVCVGLAMMEFRKRRVHRASEISRGLGIRVVGAVPRMRHLERRLIGHDGECDLEGTPVMESIDAIRTRLLHEANTRSIRVVLITSAGPGEGKTTLAAALATSLARAGRKTLLLDGDLRRPTVHELFEIPMQPGFSEVLLGEIEMSEAAHDSMQENLSVIPAGQWDREVLQALSREGLEGVFERLGEEFDFILVDSHPVLSATDSLQLGRHVDAVILSVLREVSQMPRVYAAQQQLSSLGIRILGAVVNGTDPEEMFSMPPATAGVA